MIKTYQYKIYPSHAQARTLDGWLGVCCWIYNRALEMRIKAYSRRGDKVRLYDQFVILTGWRKRIESLGLCPLGFERDAIRRVDFGMQAFFRRSELGKNRGFPRFRSRHRYNSMEYLESRPYTNGNRIRVPNLGTIRCRGRSIPEGKQKALRIICRTTGWYAQVIVDDGIRASERSPTQKSIGIDVGLNAFATLSNGDTIANPRFLKKSSGKLRGLHRRVSRRSVGSNNHRKASNKLRRQYERIADQRRCFAHNISAQLINKYDIIGVEKLNFRWLVRSRLAKSILDAAWAQFIAILARKAEDAGVQFIAVDARKTSQECPNCGAVKHKQLSERVHSCACGLTCDRDHAAARVILARALGATGANRLRTDPAADDSRSLNYQVGRLKQEDKALVAS